MRGEKDMKRIFLSILAVALLSGCAKMGSEAIDNQNEGGFSIFVSAPSTRTSFDEETYAVSWSAGDALAVTIDGVLYKFTNSTGEGNEFTCPDFTPEEGVTYTYDILYPYSENGQFTMSGGVKTPMHGTATATGSESPCAALSQLSALIKVTISNESAAGTATLSSLRIERADGGVLGGKHTVDGPVEGSTVSYTTVTNQNKSIPAGESIDMFLQCAPFTASAGTSLNIIYTVNGTAYTAVKTFTKNVKFEAGKVNRTSVSFAENQCVIKGSAVSDGAQLLTKCLEKDNLYAFHSELSAGDFYLALTGDKSGVYSPVSGNEISDGQTVALTENAEGHWTVTTAGVYRVVVDFAENTVAIYSPETDLENLSVSYNNTAQSINPYTQEVTALYMYGDFNGYSLTKHSMTQSLANPRLFTYYNSGTALPRDGKASVKFMVANFANNVYAWGASGTQTNNTNTYLSNIELDSKTMIYGGQGFNRYAFFVIPEGTNYVELFIGSEDKETTTTVSGKEIVTASDAYVLFSKR